MSYVVCVSSGFIIYWIWFVWYWYDVAGQISVEVSSKMSIGICWVAFSSIGTATPVGFGLLNYRWVFSAGSFLQSAVASGTSKPQLGGPMIRTFQLSPPGVPHVCNDTSEAGWLRTAFLKLWSALVVLLDWTLVQKKTEKIKLTWIAYHTL